MRKLLTHKELDRRLDALAGSPGRFEAGLSELISELDAEDADLEIRDPSAWRRQTPSALRTSFVQQFRADVDAILHLDREEEAQLARRIELARERVERARATAEETGGSSGRKAPRKGTRRVGHGRKAALARLNRRALELHALRTEMVERNLYLVLINVERYAQSGASRLDLIQEGCVSLFRAVDGFDWRRGLLFRTYAVHWLNQAFRNFLYNSTHTVRVPVYLQKALKHINQATIRLEDQNATPEDIARSADLNANLVAAALRAARGSFSIDAESGESEDGSRLRDLLVDEDNEGPYTTRVEDVSLEAGLERALGDLSDRERLVVRMRYGIGTNREHTLAEVAERLGVSVERVRQIQVRALHKLNTPTLRRDLDPFLN